MKKIYKSDFEGKYADMQTEKNNDTLPYCLTIAQASKVFGIGEKTLRRFIKEHIREDYIIQIGSHTRIKRDLFKKYLDENITVL